MNKKIENIEPKRKKSEVIQVIILAYLAAMIGNIGNILQGNWVSSVFVIVLAASSVYFYLDRKPSDS